DNACDIEDCAEGMLTNPLRDISEAFVRPAGREVAPGQPAGTRDACLLALDGEAIRLPVSQAGGVFVDLAELLLDKSCGKPGTQVALVIGAVCHRRPCGFELAQQLGGEVSQRYVNRAGNMLFDVLLGWQGIDDLRPFFDKTLDLAVADPRRLTHRTPRVKTSGSGVAISRHSPF